MFHPAPQYLTDANGTRTAVLISLEDYQAMLASLEELETLRAYDQAKAGDDEAVPFDEAIADIERNH
jgi:hypothetical protein